MSPGVEGRLARQRATAGRAPTRPGVRLLRRVWRDPHLALTSALALPSAVVGLVAGGPAGLGDALRLGVAFAAGQAALGLIRQPAAARTRLALSLLRLLVSLLFVIVAVEVVPEGRTLVSLYLPIVAVAAILGPVPAVVLVAAAGFAYAIPVLIHDGLAAEATLRGIALASVSVIVAVSIRWTKGSLDRALAELRRSLAAGVRRERQVTGLADVGAALAATGPTPETLDMVVGLLATRFRHRYVALFLADGDSVRLGAQRGYDALPTVLDASRGVMGRAIRRGRAVLVPEVGLDPDYVAADPAVRSEIAVPLLSEGELLGALNVESTAPIPLDAEDRRALEVLADRLAAAIALGRDRQRLAERERLARHLVDFSAAISATLDPRRLFEAIVATVTDVVPAEMMGLTVLDPATGRYLVRAVVGLDAAAIGAEVRPGEGMAGRAIRDRALVLSEQYELGDVPAPLRDLVDAPLGTAAGVPIIREGSVIGALSLVRATGAFTPAEQDAMRLVAAQAALAIANVLLHAEVNDLAIRDPLTGLYNRRYFDAVLEQLLASHGRDPAGRPPLSAVMFDLDHFGQVNKLHGHQFGDLVLQAFGRLVAGRFRESDLVARFGGEEFVVILDRTTVTDAERLADEVRRAMASARFEGANGELLHVTVSAGCAELEPSEPTREALLRATDVALFMAKRGGRDRVVAQPTSVRLSRRAARALDTAEPAPGPSPEAGPTRLPTGGWKR